MNFKQREKILVSESQLEDFIKVQKRVKFYALHLEKFIETKNIDDLNLTPPKHFYEFIQELRVFDSKQVFEECNFLLLRLLNIAKKLAKIVISLPKIYANLIWIIRDILGRDSQLFSTLLLSEQQINIINIAIKSKHSEYWPFVILARYLDEKYHQEFFPLIKEYASTTDTKFWNKSIYAAETLAFFKIKPEESLKCMVELLNHTSCDENSADKIFEYMVEFCDYDYLVVDELVEYFESVPDFTQRPELLIHLTEFIQSRDVASILLPYLSIVLQKNTSKNSKNLFKSTNRGAQLLLIFYGHLQAIVNRDM